MATKDVDLSTLRINRGPPGMKAPRGSRWSGKTIGWLIVLALALAAVFFFRDWLNPAIEVQLATASLTSPSQATAVLTASVAAAGRLGFARHHPERPIRTIIARIG